MLHAKPMRCRSTAVCTNLSARLMRRMLFLVREKVAQLLVPITPASQNRPSAPYHPFSPSSASRDCGEGSLHCRAL